MDLIEAIRYLCRGGCKEEVECRWGWLIKRMGTRADYMRCLDLVVYDERGEATGGEEGQTDF